MTTRAVGGGAAADCIRTGCASRCSPTRTRRCSRSKALAEEVRDGSASRSRRTIRCCDGEGASRPGSRLAGGLSARRATPWTEAFFLSTYGSPLLQAVVGLGPQHAPTRAGASSAISRARRPRHGCAPSSSTHSRSGGAAEAALRALIYVRLPEGSVDERGFAMLQAIRAAQPPAAPLSMARAQGRC